jgi:aspartate racemase
MKTLGLIGGIGPESTVEYYRMLIAGYREKTNGEYPSIIINSIDLDRLLRWMTANELDKAADYVSVEIERLHKAGADFAALASNTPHIVFDELQRRSKLPLLSIVEAASQKAQSLGLHTVALLGTRFTMQATFYQNVFERAGIKLVTPNEDEQAYIHDKYINELLKNIFLPETRSRLLAIVDILKERHNIQALILGGTELPLLLKDEEHNGITLIDTGKVHVDVLLRELLR